MIIIMMYDVNTSLYLIENLGGECRGHDSEYSISPVASNEPSIRSDGYLAYCSTNLSLKQLVLHDTFVIAVALVNHQDAVIRCSNQSL